MIPHDTLSTENIETEKCADLAVAPVNKDEENFGFEIVNPPEIQLYESTHEKGRVFTAFLCGTCCSSNTDQFSPEIYPNGEIISSLHAKVKGETFVDKEICDGPGSGGNDKSKLWVTPENCLAQNVRGVLFANGIDERIQHVLNIVANKQPEFSAQYEKQNPEHCKTEKERYEVIRDRLASGALKPIEHINIVGWSRGGAASIKLANEIYKAAKKENRTPPSISLFLVDPVPGFGLIEDAHVSLPENVQNCFIVYAHDERSFGFSPIKIQDSRCLSIALHGHHATVAGSIANHQEGDRNPLRADAGKLAAGYFTCLLSLHGTDIESSMTLKELTALHQQMLANADCYVVLRNSAYTGRQFTRGARKAIASSRGMQNVSLNREETPADFLNIKIQQAIKKAENFYDGQDFLKNILDKTQSNTLESFLLLKAAYECVEQAHANQEATEKLTPANANRPNELRAFFRRQLAKEKPAPVVAPVQTEEEQIIDKAKQGLTKYLARSRECRYFSSDPHSHLGFFAWAFQRNKGKKRAENALLLLQEATTTEQKMAVIVAILTHRQMKTTKSDLREALGNNVRPKVKSAQNYNALYQRINAR